MTWHAGLRGEMETLHLRKRPCRDTWQHHAIWSAISMCGTDHSRHSPPDSQHRYIEPLTWHKLELAERDHDQFGGSAQREYHSVHLTVVAYQQLSNGGNTLPGFVEDG